MPSPAKTLPIMKSIETQTNGEIAVREPTVTESKPVVREMTAKDLRAESKIIIDVTKANKKERSEVTSLTKLDDSGKISRTTHVTTSQHIPVKPVMDTKPMARITDGYPRAAVRPQSPQRPMPSPIRKAQSEIDVTPVSNVSTRPASADDLSMPTITTAPQIPTTLSYGSSTHSLKSSLKTPSPTFHRYDTSDDITVPRVGRVSIQDPLHLVVIAPPDKFGNKCLNGNGLLMPIDKSRWKETRSSTICNEMTTDAFKDEDG